MPYLDGISVVVPLYNKAATVCRALQSIRQCPAPVPVEIIVVNDASTDLDDAQREILLSFDVRWIDHDSNLGPGAARNTGVSSAAYGWVMFLDADDYWHKTYLENMVRAIKHEPQADIISTGFAIRFKNRETRYREYRVDDSIISYRGTEYFAIARYGVSPVVCSNVAVKKQVLVECGGFPESIRDAEDLWLWSRLALEGKNFSFVNRCLATYDMTNSEYKQRSRDYTSLSPHIRMIEDWYAGPGQEIPVAVKEYIAHYKSIFFFRLTEGCPHAAKYFVRKEKHSLIPARLSIRMLILVYLPVWSYRLFYFIYYRMRIRPGVGRGLLPVSEARQYLVN